MHGLDTKTSGIPCATPYSHRPVQKFLARIGQSEIVAAINGPIAHFWLPKAKSSMISRARARAYVCQGEAGISHTIRGTKGSGAGQYTGYPHCPEGRD